MDTQLTHDETVLIVKGAILTSMEDGTVPYDAPNFSALHDYVDANTYLLDEQGEPWSWLHDEVDFDKSNAVLDEVDAWLRARQR